MRVLNTVKPSFLTVIASAAMAALVLGVVFISAGDRSGLFSGNVGQTMKGGGNGVDFSVDMVLADGSTKPLRISELRGKIVILEFTFIGCSACEVLHTTGYLQNVYEKFKEKIEVVTIYIYKNTDPHTILQYAKTYGLNWKYFAIDRSGNLIIDLRIPNLFTHIFLDEDGVERFRNPGAINFVKTTYPTIIDLMLQKKYDELEKYHVGEIIDVG
ncbi:MAG: TlpA disulfide reductase family protein [Candidatus Caldarchaeum sp.]